MRPLQLSFAGIRSYPGTVGPLDFADKTLIAILGDTGAGKSTILEAITLGLYGNCTWTDREYKPLMAEGATQMSVDFTFAHEGQRWRVRRIFHAKTTPATHLLQNLDTGEQVDGARAINHRIETLLRLSFNSFKAAVLLPQGQFDRLLTATGRERTTLLKGIFGVEAIETVRYLTGRHREQLTDVIHQAELSRRDLLGNPAASAAAAAKDAEQAERLAEHLHQALADLRACREQASHARTRHQKLAAAITSLDQHEKRDIPSALARIGKADDDLAALVADADQAEEECKKHQAAADVHLAAAAKGGLTPESLASAGTLLDAVPGRLEELAADQGQLGGEAREIAEQGRQLETAKGEVGKLQALAGSLANARTAAESTLAEYGAASGRLQDSIRTALLKAADIGQALQDQEQALRHLQDRQKAFSPLVTAAAIAAADLQSAEERLSDIRSHDAAHTAGAGLSPGEACFICQRPLPDDYQPPPPANPHALRAAQQATNKAREADKEATENLAQARAHAASANRGYDDRQAEAQRVQARLEQAWRDAAAAMQVLMHRQWGDCIQPPGTLKEFEARLESVCWRLARAERDDQEKLHTSSTRELLGPVHTLERSLAEAAKAAEDTATKADKEWARASATRLLQQTTHSQAEARFATARKRYESTEAKLGRDLKALPLIARQQIPGDVRAVTPSHIAAARQTITDQQEKLDAVRQDRDNASTELARLARTQRQLDQRRNREVTGPLQALATYLERWQEVIEQAAGALPSNLIAESMPTRPTAIAIEDIRVYATAVVNTARTVQGSVSSAATSAEKEANTQLRRLEATACGLRAGQQGHPAIALGERDELLDPAALDPLVAAERSARDTATRYRAHQADAESQIERADTLDAAIEAGQARASAVNALHGLLAEGKFLQYLTDKRTRALLGVASDNLGRLSGGEFGFAEEFQIISRHSGATRSPKTLSGGETFLASLALAMALVELHSRSGARLGALFLDEGFGSLDLDTLASSLSMLQAEIGEDKLVAVISHLHPIAEAVEDVIWVERGPEGSLARWLTAGERDALMRQEITGGLLNLI